MEKTISKSESVSNKIELFLKEAKKLQSVNKSGKNMSSISVTTSKAIPKPVFNPDPGSVADGVLKNAIARQKGDRKLLKKKYKR